MSWALYKCKFLNNQTNSKEFINTNNDLQERRRDMCLNWSVNDQKKV